MEAWDIAVPWERRISVKGPLREETIVLAMSGVFPSQQAAMW
jgi:hypothetical protein